MRVGLLKVIVSLDSQVDIYIILLLPVLQIQKLLWFIAFIDGIANNVTASFVLQFLKVRKGDLELE